MPQDTAQVRSCPALRLHSLAVASRQRPDLKLEVYFRVGLRTRQCAMSDSVCCRNSPRLAASASVEHSTSSTMSLITCAIDHKLMLMESVGEIVGQPGVDQQIWGIPTAGPGR